MRSIIVAFYLLLYAIVSLPLFLIFYIIGKFSSVKEGVFISEICKQFWISSDSVSIGSPSDSQGTGKYLARSGGIVCL